MKRQTKVSGGIHRFFSLNSVDDVTSILVCVHVERKKSETWVAREGEEPSDQFIGMNVSPDDRSLFYPGCFLSGDAKGKRGSFFFDRRRWPKRDA